MNGRIRTRRALLTGLAAAMLGAAPAVVAQPYHIVDIGTLDNAPMSFGFALNNLGRVAGLSTVGTDLRGFLWDGSLTALSPLAGDLQSHAVGLNDGGQVIATSFDLGELSAHGLLWQAGTITDLGPLSPRGINGLGLIAGHLSTSTASISAVDHAATWQAGTLTDLGTLGGSFSYAAAVSNWGQVVGWSFLLGDTTVRATLWQSGVPHDLGTLGGLTSQAYDISRESGYVAGVADTAAGAPHAFLFRVNASGAVTTRTDLGELAGGSSYAYGVNNLGQAVGTSDGRAFRWVGGVVTDLNTLLPPGSPWRLEVARAINDGGQIVGTGVYQGQSRAFLLAQVGDLDADGDVDLADYAAFGICLGGPGVAAAPSGFALYDFKMSDLDGDGDADLSDFALFQQVFPHP